MPGGKAIPVHRHLHLGFFQKLAGRFGAEGQLLSCVAWRHQEAYSLCSQVDAQDMRHHGPRRLQLNLFVSDPLEQ